MREAYGSACGLKTVSSVSSLCAFGMGVTGVKRRIRTFFIQWIHV